MSAATLATMSGARIPHRQGDPFWYQTILLLTGNNPANFLQDFSFQNQTFSNNGGALRDTADAVHSKAAIDCRQPSGLVTVSREDFYGSILLDGPWTLDGWLIKTADSFGVNNRACGFAAMTIASVPSTINFNVVIGGDSVGVNDSLGVGMPVGASTYFAIVRQKGTPSFVGQDQLCFYLGNRLTSVSSGFTSTNVIEAAHEGPDVLGWESGGTQVIFDGLRLTSANRYLPDPITLQPPSTITPPQFFPTFFGL